ncbi:LPS-assembly protein LptD [Parvularcula maris]|uniref:LPS-assembly protein LptD n=1 Tax=Parvularcula maris TaxID=2965077 RepID=A0A9X2RI51_9PROT|nr:LPS assembly protein LptD [Parvularcula maris]MCQ8185594.1 LPS assembly protein LptD [Parvularcula maris]
MVLSLLFAVGAALSVQDTPPPAAVSEDDLLFTAANVDRTEDGLIVAEGDVRASAEGRFIRADRVIYDPELGLVTAEGNVVVTDETGQMYFADKAELTSDLANGIAEMFEAELAPNGTLAAATVVRRDDGTNTLRKATFTLCQVCETGLRKDRPVWQLKARRVIQDEDAKVLRFRNAFIEVLGIPTVWVPYAQLPDPSVDRATGFLPPDYRNSTRRGNEFEVPFYVAISDYQDFTFSPRYYDILGLMFKGEYRRNTYNSAAVVQAGIINPTNDLSEEAGSPDPIRWHWFSRYTRDLPADWTFEADIDGVSDRGYLLTYDIEPRGELRDRISILRPDRLDSNVSFRRKTDRSFTDVSNYVFQTLRFNEDQEFVGQALPRLRHEQYFQVPGGEVTLGGSFLSLFREDGVDSMRGSAHARYRSSYTTKSGHRFEGFAELRGDTYHYQNADQGIQVCNVQDGFFETCRLGLPRDGLEEDFSFQRFLPTVGAEWSFPLARLGENTSLIITPRVQAVAAPDRSFRDDVFNEDSQFFQFDTVTLFDYNKSAGLDLWEDGRRVNVGVETAATVGNWLTVDTLVGTQFRSEATDAFEPNTGIGEVQSDFVGAVDVRLFNNLAFDNRFRIDDDTGSFRRLESSVGGRLGRLSGGLNYLRIEDDNFETNGILDEFLIVNAALKVTRHISIAAVQAQNLDSGDSTNTEVALRLANRCSALSIRYRFDDSNVEGFEQDREIFIRFDILGFN